MHICMHKYAFIHPVPNIPQYKHLIYKQHTDLNFGDKGLKLPGLVLANLITAPENNFRKIIATVIHTDGIGGSIMMVVSLSVLSTW